MKPTRVVLLNTYTPYCPNIGLAVMFDDGHIETISRYSSYDGNYPSLDYLLTGIKECKYSVNNIQGNKTWYEPRWDVSTFIQEDSVFRTNGVLDAFLTGKVPNSRKNNIFVFKTIEDAIKHFENNPLNRTRVKGELASHHWAFRDRMVKFKSYLNK